MDWLDEQGLAALYPAPGAAATDKVADRITPEYRAWIERARFCVLSTAGAGGTDGSPRGDDGPVLRVLDDGHLALPDWRGNDRIDSLKNIVADPRVSLMLLVRGAKNVIRVNGRARLTADPALCASFARGNLAPRCVIVVAVDEVYFQCARAVIRSGLWSGQDDSAGLPTPGEILAALTGGAVGGAAYDAAWPARAAASMW